MMRIKRAVMYMIIEDTERTGTKMVSRSMADMLSMEPERTFKSGDASIRMLQTRHRV